ncbi:MULTISPECIES: energy-coupled thiamine transporter ThiT [Sutcliffiella]|uniref:Energy-coupled thiamine transporter ThiT n=1 Tax=Sutcliffiella cohnii TaxID=33932 RepID=A0A223KQ83_9BACI|nr:MULTISPECIES: energy-coupled thiamine transporter ThiT [Sutcliffiella]AST91493.1 energy-coupled thiamine transporter ThiT [Sutcliffiella cohnii]MED4014940.1 energy-coupled thiamine transporter ThiT [Sutcliffiella cohnii]WBL17325.1 energy-coupled thiamine transporter ThiT [Sutcliffiella sp. NC1]
MERERLVTMVEISMMAALAVILSYVKFGALWAYGGSISLIMVPIFVIAFRRGWKAGVVTGLLVGVINWLTGGYVVHPAQLILDYPLPFALLGFAAIFAVKGVTIRTIVVGMIFGTALRLISHFLSGVIWFGEYAPDGIPVVLYSIIYNLSYLVPEMLITIAILVIIYKFYPKFFKANA